MRPVEDCERVDIRYLRRRGLLTEGGAVPVSWNEGGLVKIQVQGPVAILSYRGRADGGAWETIRWELPLVWTSCNFGGQRPCKSPCKVIT